VLARLLAFISEHQLIFPQDTILLAVSGGLDSMVLLHSFYHIQNELAVNLQVLHVNHGLRGRESDLDEELVKDTCSGFKIPFWVKRLQGFTVESSEEALRAARYAAFSEWLQKVPHSKIATAHHLNDQVETFLMRLAKGSGTKGLLGIPVQRPGFIRPFLFLRRRELEAYAEETGLSFREDRTNQDVGKLRNRIRRYITPSLERTFGAAFYAGFQKSRNDLALTHKAYRELSARFFKEHCRRAAQNLVLERRFYLGLNIKLRRSLTEYCISYFYPLNSKISTGIFKEFDSFVRGAETGSIFMFSAGLTAYKDRQGITFKRTEEQQNDEIELYPEQTVVFGRNKISLKQVTYKDIKRNADSNVEFICSSRLKWPLIVRCWRAADYFYPLGLKRKQKVSDFFVNNKIDRSRKNSIPLIWNGDELVWVVGMRLDERYKISRNCKSYYRLNNEEESD